MSDAVDVVEQVAAAVAEELRGYIDAAVRSNEQVAKQLEAALAASPATEPSTDPVVDVELRRWRDNARNRVKKGNTPRRFVSDVIPDQVAARVWARLEHARTVDQVTAAFDTAKAARPKGGDQLTFGHRLADLIIGHYAPRLRRALTARFDPDKLADKAAATVTKAAGDADDVRRILEQAPPMDPSAVAILRDLYADGYLTGTQTVVEHMPANRRAVSVQSGPGALGANIDWAAWEPGNAAAADLVAAADGTNGLAALLDQAGVTIRSIDATLMDDLANLIAHGLAGGDGPDALARDIRGLLDNPDRADMIARTETARAQEEASQDVYAANGVPMQAWLEEDDACPECMENGDASPIGIDDEWPNGDVPVHPNCRCATAPHYPDGS